MTSRQRDRFLWHWAQRRGAGIVAVAGRGALIGAIGGLCFSLLLLGDIDLGAARGGASPLGRLGMLLGLSLGAFSMLGLVLSAGVFASNEQMFQTLLASGASVPDAKPPLAAGDRGPGIVVAVVAAVLGIAIVALIVTYG